MSARPHPPAPQEAASAPPDRLAAARAAAEAVTDPELPVVTLADLGILRGLAVDGDDRVTVTVTPTYSGCPAMDAIRADLRRALRRAGFARVEVRTALRPAWSTDRITTEGRHKLAAAGIAPPGPAPGPRSGPVPLTLGPTRQGDVPCPRCGSTDTTELARFGATACKALWRCVACREPFEHVKPI